MLSGLKAFIPGTARYSRKHHVKYLQKKARGHDVLLLVEWEDGQLTELAADVAPEMDGWYRATNGLIFAPAGEGADPVDYYGVPVIRCHSQIACPFSTEACLAADYDEAGEFTYETDDGDDVTQEVYEVEMGPPAESPGDATNGHDGDVAADGGVDVRRYDLRPPANSVGHTFSLTQAKQRAPNAISANMLRRAFEYGKEKARQEGLYMRGLLHGGGLVLGTLIILAILYIVGMSVLGGGGGSGGGGGGGGAVLSSLLLTASPRLREGLADVRDDVAELATWIRRHPKLAAFLAARQLVGGATAITLGVGYLLATATGAVYWNEYLESHPQLATETVAWFGGQIAFTAWLSQLYWIAVAALPLGALYLHLRWVEPSLKARWRGGDADAAE